MPPKPLVKDFVKNHVKYFERTRNKPPKTKIGRLESKYLYPKKIISSNNIIDSLYQKVKSYFGRYSSRSTNYGNSQTCLTCDELLKLASSKKRAHIKGSSYNTIIKNLINRLHKVNSQGLYYINVTEFYKAFKNEHIKELTNISGNTLKLPAIIPLCEPCHTELNKMNSRVISIKWLIALLQMTNYDNNYKDDLLLQIKKSKVVGDIKDVTFRKMIRNYYKVYNNTPIVKSTLKRNNMNINITNLFNKMNINNPKSGVKRTRNTFNVNAINYQMKKAHINY